MIKRYPITFGFLTFLALLLVAAIISRATANASCNGTNYCGNTPPVPRWTLVRVYDGDTIRVRLGDTTESVRLVMIDTPETLRPGTPIQCWGPQASLYTKALLPYGTQLVLHRDPALLNRDRYGRLLRYVYKGRININYRLVREGYAKVYIYRGQRGVQTERLLLAEARARLEGTGLWGPPCYGDTKKPQP